MAEIITCNFFNGPLAISSFDCTIDITHAEAALLKPNTAYEFESVMFNGTDSKTEKLKVIFYYRKKKDWHYTRLYGKWIKN